MEIFTYLVITPVFKNSYTAKPYRADLKLLKEVKGASISGNAVAIKLCIDVPDSIFSKPQLQANIKIDKDNISPPVIEASVLDNISETLKQQLGIDLKIQVVTAQ